MTGPHYPAREPTDRELAMAEQHVAYDGHVTLRNWIDSSAHGFKLVLDLESRAELDHFDGVMAYRKKRGGQRYMAIIQPYWYPDGVGKPDASRQFVQEWLFAGRGWSESKGAHIAVLVRAASEIDYWKINSTTEDQATDDDRISRYYVMLLELEDDETIVNQEKRERVIPMEEKKGGPKSKAVAQLLSDRDFVEWLSWSIYSRLDDPDRYEDPANVDQLIKQVCRIESKKQFDLEPDKWELFENQFHRPFIHHMRRTRG